MGDSGTGSDLPLLFSALVTVNFLDSSHSSEAGEVGRPVEGLLLSPAASCHLPQGRNQKEQQLMTETAD